MIRATKTEVIMQSLVEIAEFVAQNTRNKLVFCDHSIDGVSFVDVGFELSLLLSKSPYDNDEALAVILGQSQQHAEIGTYLAIRNIGILFEPELKLNIRNIFDSYSKNLVFIIQSDGEILDGVFYFLKPTDRNAVSLQGLSYMIV